MTFMRHETMLRSVGLSAGFALLLGCSAGDQGTQPDGSSQDSALRGAPKSNGSGPGRGQGHGPGRGHGHGHGHGHGSGSGGGSGGSASAGGATGSGGASSSAGTGNTTGGVASGGIGPVGGSGGYGNPGICGDGQWGIAEQCDDGNTLSGDGCTATCQIEPNYTCYYFGEPCDPAACGDGEQQQYLLSDGTFRYEGCDDGNSTSGDGCSTDCEVEAGWVCNQPGTACHQPECGDGYQDFTPGGGSGGTGAGGGVSGYYEPCDDGNTTSGDGCSASCEVEAGWLCPLPGVPCRQPRCGDGYQDFIPDGSSTGGTGGFGGGGPSGTWEGCDDGNTAPSDGCDGSCNVEAGWTCGYFNADGVYSCHRIVCGDGIADWGTETCDDGNVISGDGCSSTCQYEGFGGSGGGGPVGTSGSGGFTGGYGGFTGGTGGAR